MIYIAPKTEKNQSIYKYWSQSLFLATYTLLLYSSDRPVETVMPQYTYSTVVLSRTPAMRSAYLRTAAVEWLPLGPWWHVQTARCRCWRTCRTEREPWCRVVFSGPRETVSCLMLCWHVAGTDRRWISQCELTAATSGTWLTSSINQSVKSISLFEEQPHKTDRRRDKR